MIRNRLVVRSIVYFPSMFFFCDASCLCCAVLPHSGAMPFKIMLYACFSTVRRGLRQMLLCSGGSVALCLK